MTTRFTRIVLRTTDVAAARRFYAAVLGPRALEIEALPPDVAARGAPAHWLGQLGVDDVEATASAFVAHGATRLGPTRPTHDGGRLAIVRDPGGAVVALVTRSARGPEGEVVWHQLTTGDLPRVLAAYADVLGWARTARVEHGEHGVHQEFAFAQGEPSAGSIAALVDGRGIHAHWLFHFRVDDLDAALATVRVEGALIANVVTLADGARIAVCDDPQGAAFALRA